MSALSFLTPFSPKSRDDWKTGIKYEFSCALVGGKTILEAAQAMLEARERCLLRENLSEKARPILEKELAFLQHMISEKWEQLPF